VGLRDFVLPPGETWSDLDRKAGSVVGCPGIAIPSIRVAIAWTLEFLGCDRHADHVLVPGYVGRCVLNTIGRHALPVDVPTGRTKAVVVVSQFGFRQDLHKIQAECEARAIPYMEDSPFGVEPDEALGPGSVAKFVGLSKVLPLIKGGFAISDNEELLEFMRRKRAGRSMWSWPVLLMMGSLRRGLMAPAYSVLADMAYELYPEVAGDNWALRGNFGRALDLAASFEELIAGRLRLLEGALGSRVKLPDTSRLTSVALLSVGEDEQIVASTLKRVGFDSGTYHFDVRRNLFRPHYERVFLIPVGPRVPESTFANLLAALSASVV
jgi:hypothetical protein